MLKQAIVCDQQKLYALGCSTILKEQSFLDDYYIVHNFDDLSSATHLFPSSLLILDSSLLQFEDPATAYKIASLKKSNPIMVVFNEEDDLQLYNIIDSGICVVVTRNVSQEEYVKAMDMAFQDKIFFCSNIENRVYDLVKQSDKLKLIELVNALDKFDKYILVRICEEASSKEIALEMFCSKRTVEGHRTRLMQKLGVKNVAGLVKVAFLTKLYENYLANPGLYDLTA
jgi:DNA-binding NarL/FixJ family response regulator